MGGRPSDSVELLADDVVARIMLGQRDGSFAANLKHFSNELSPV